MEKKIFDITLPIYNGMWSYREEWKNQVKIVSSTKNGDPSTVYNFNIHSHTGTYIETTQHKLNNSIVLSDFDLSTFYCISKVVVVLPTPDGTVSLENFNKELELKNIEIEEGDNLIIATSWGKNHKEKDYLSESPSFDPNLTDWIIKKNIALLGVDTPIIENLKNPYNPVMKMFLSNEKMLLLAPLLIDVTQVNTGIYRLSCFPAIVSENISSSLCRAILMEE